MVNSFNVAIRNGTLQVIGMASNVPESAVERDLPAALVEMAAGHVVRVDSGDYVKLVCMYVEALEAALEAKQLETV